MLAPPQRREATRARQARYRARRRNGDAVFHLTANRDLIVGGLLDAGRISEPDALDPRNVERVLSDMLTEWGQRYWREARG